jgi:hypothetical protein
VFSSLKESCKKINEWGEIWREFNGILISLLKRKEEEKLLNGK